MSGFIGMLGSEDRPGRPACGAAEQVHPIQGAGRGPAARQAERPNGVPERWCGKAWLRATDAGQAVHAAWHRPSPGIVGIMGMVGIMGATGARSSGFTRSISYTGARSTTTFSRERERERRRSRLRERRLLHQGRANLWPRCQQGPQRG